MSKKIIYVAHGAISNAGDFLIYNRGMKLLEKYIDKKNVTLVPVERWKPITGYSDALIILGGPIITRKIHSQAVNIRDYLDEHNIPVICLGVGISGKYYPSSESDFLDLESKEFWTSVYNYSNLFSVRDFDTYSILKNNNISANLTGCPALFDIEYIENCEHQDIPLKCSNGKIKIVVTIPNLKFPLFADFIKSLFLVGYLNVKVIKRNPDIKGQIVFQHGHNSLINNTFANIAKVYGFDIIDGSNKGIDEIIEIIDSDIHIGTRLHMNIYFLSRGKLSYLLNVDNRTKAFIDTFTIPSETYTINGIKKLVNECNMDLNDDEMRNQKVNLIKNQISEFHPRMVTFIQDIIKYVA